MLRCDYGVLVQAPLPPRRQQAPPKQQAQQGTINLADSDSDGAPAPPPKQVGCSMLVQACACLLCLPLAALQPVPQSRDVCTKTPHAWSAFGSEL